MALRTPKQVRQTLADNGISVTQWALDNQVSPNLVLEILAGRNKATRGKSHAIAIKLGLKEGIIGATPSKALEHVA